MDRQLLVERVKTYIDEERDPGFRDEVSALLAQENWTELEDRFYRDLEFGTGGLRGVIGGGFNRMNSLVVKRATQGLANYIKKSVGGAGLSAAIAFDSRRFSPEFALAAALVFAGNGIKAYLFSSLRPTPELSFAVSRLGCATGVVLTASHNPPQYNGYKAYWSDGAQVIPPHDSGIIAEVKAVRQTRDLTEEEALQRGLLVRIDKEIDIPYVDMVRSKLFRPNLFKAMAGSATVVYTPLHGTGARHVEGVLGGLGLQVVTVPEQREPDGEFPTVAFPNPEEAAALKMAIELGTKIKADVVMATDPDADRLGIAVPDASGAFTLISGNQLGSLLADYILLSLKELAKMPLRPAMINTIVSTGMHKQIAASYGAECFECLTGFKWIADVWKRKETQGYEIVLGTEESYGYLVEREVRDKDAISAAAMTAEMTLYWRDKGLSLLERLDELYRRHGFWMEMGISKYFKGAKGGQIMKGIMDGFRTSPPESLGGLKLEKIRDLLESVWKYPAQTERREQVELPKSDVLQFFLEDGTIVSARPSGTEPKIKFYATSRTEVGADGIAPAREALKRKLALIEHDIRAVIGE